VRVALTFVAGLVAFGVVATLNSGGYRYGAADQAFYIPAILLDLDPTLFPRDRALVGPQSRYFFVDEIVATLVRFTGWPIEAWFATGYLATLGVLYAALWHLGHVVFRSPLATIGLIAAESLRHRITKTGVNTLEGYFHPRVLVFAIGVAAIVAYLRGRPWVALGAVGLAGLVHPTSAAFFLLFLGVAVWTTEPATRRVLLGLALPGVSVVAWVLVAGPLRGALAPMDAEWLSVLAGKDYLFPTRDWDAGAWLANLGTGVVAVVGLRARLSRGAGVARERGLLAGAVALLSLFVLTLPLVAAGSALVVQLQISRVFWILELLAVTVVVAAVLDRPDASPAASRGRPWREAIAAGLILVAVARGGWIALVEHADRPLVSVTLPDEDWTRVLAWAHTQHAGAHWLADPGHAWRYGVPLRYSGRDTFVEEVKDSAMAIYSKDAAARLLDRQLALGDFSTLDEERARALAAAHDVDYLVIDRDLNLPRVHQEGRFRVYRLR
jgi:hypothetical protein